MTIPQFKKIVQDKILNIGVYVFFRISLGVLEENVGLTFVGPLLHQSSWFLQIKQVELIQFDLLESILSHPFCHDGFVEGGV